MISEVIPAALAGERIDRVLAMITGCTRSEASAALAASTVTVNGAVVTKPSSRVQEGDAVAVASDPHVPEELPGPDPDVEVRTVHVDDDVIVVDKPAGLVVHPGAGHRGATLVNGLLAAFPDLAGVGEPHRPGIVHRLDKGTSGLMVVARTPDAYDDLVAQLSTHTVDRRYVALVWGEMASPAGTIDAPIGRSRRNPLMMTISTAGRPSRTHYQVERTLTDPQSMSVVSLRLETGRTHQIRVHLRSIGHPVVGDDAYGGRRPLLGLGRPFLHARHLSFDHPATGDEASFESPLAEDLVAVLAELGVPQD